MGVLKVNVGTATTPDWRNIGCDPTSGGIVDDFNRADGTSVLTARSDGGTWMLGSLNDMAISGGKLIRSAGAGGISNASQQWIYAGYNQGSLDTITATFTFARNLYVNSVSVRVYPSVYAWIATDAARNSGIEMWISQDTIFLESFPANATFSSAATASGGWYDGLPHTAQLSYTYSTRRTVVAIDGVIYIDATAPTSIATSNLFAMFTTDDYATAGCYFDDVNVTGQPVAGRLKLWTGTAWLREKCSTDTTVARPLRMWDGTTWQTVACMTYSPADATAAGVYDTATYDYAVFG